MRRSRDLRLSNLRPALLLAGALAVPSAALGVLGAREADDLYVTPLVAVGATMLVATVAAILLTRAGTRRGPETPNNPEPEGPGLDVVPEPADSARAAEPGRRPDWSTSGPRNSELFGV